MKRILMTTALVAFASTPVLAQTQPTTDTADTAGHEMTMQTQHGIYLTPTGEATIYGSEFIGKNVYVTEGANDLRAVDGVPDNWENVAAIDDVLMTRDGEVRGVLIDVGGFLGIGARKVAVDMSALDIVYDRDDNDFYVVFTSTREDLESAPEYDTSIDTQNRVETWESAGMARDGAEQRPTDMQAAESPVTGAAQPMERDLTARDGYTNVAHGDLSVDDLTSASVYSANDENIAGVSDVLVTEDGRVTNLIVDVGGFLGIGAKSVAIDFDQVTVYRGDDADDLRIHLPMTRDQLEDMPEYEG